MFGSTVGISSLEDQVCLQNSGELWSVKIAMMRPSRSRICFSEPAKENNMKQTGHFTEAGS